MQNTTHYNLKKPDYTDFADIQDINDNMDTIDEELAAPTGDARNQVVSFTDADLDSGISSFPTFLTKIVSGMKLAKFLRDFKAGMAYVLHVGDLINNATCTESGKALDARMGKTLQDQITSLNDSLPLCKTHSFTETIPAGGRKEYALSSLGLTTPTGFSRVNIFAGASGSGTSAYFSYAISDYNFDYVVIRNSASSAMTWTIRVSVLFISSTNVLNV